MAALPTMGGDHGNYTKGPTTEQKQRYALRQCFLLAIREARREQKADNTRSTDELGRHSRALLNAPSEKSV